MKSYDTKPYSSLEPNASPPNTTHCQTEPFQLTTPISHPVINTNQSTELLDKIGPALMTENSSFPSTAYLWMENTGFWKLITVSIPSFGPVHNTVPCGVCVSRVNYIIVC